MKLTIEIDAENLTYLAKALGVSASENAVQAVDRVQESTATRDEDDIWAGVETVAQRPGRDATDESALRTVQSELGAKTVEETTVETQGKVVKKWWGYWAPEMTNESCPHGAIAVAKVSQAGKPYFRWACSKQFDGGNKATGCKGDWLDKPDVAALKDLLPNNWTNLVKE